MLLFRFSNYNKYSFIDEHLNEINNNKYVWMLKAGRKSNMVKIADIIKQGGYMILKAPKADNGKYYVARFTEVQELMPEDKKYPEYYEEFMDDMYSEEQWFKLTEISELADSDVNKLVLEKNSSSVSDVISTTRTSVMFIKNKEDIKY